MQPILPAIIFGGIVATVFALAALIIVRRILQKIKWSRGGVRPQGLSWPDRIVLGLAAGGALCFAYGYFIEPYWPSVTHIQIKTAKFKAGSRPIRLVQISDLHCDSKPRLEERLPALIANERPDLIVFTGDSINSPDGLPVLKTCLTSLAQIAPTFVVKGNWDMDFWHHLDLFGSTGVQELNGDMVVVNKEGSGICIAGIAAGDESRAAATTDKMPAEAFNIFLYHYPDLIFEIAARHVDLYCAGHTHGGQVALPFYGALITLSRFGKRFESGLYRVDQTLLYVNRGLGMDGGMVPRVRFFARPEITVFDIQPDTGG